MTPLHPRARSGCRFTAAAIGLALVVACGLSLLAVGSPDGLEFVARDAGFSSTARESTGVFAGYASPGVGSGSLSTALAGAAGCAAVFGLAMLAIRLTRPRGR